MIKNFSTVGPNVIGYNTNQVDIFFANVKKHWNDEKEPVTERIIRFQSFSPQKGGYLPADVDEGLIRLELTLAKRDKDMLLKKYELQGWMQMQNNRIASLWETLNSPNKQRFSTASDDKKSYHFGDVDKLMKMIKTQLFDGKQLLTSTDLRSVKFSMVKPRKGYNTSEVDYFLDETISIFNQLEID